MKQISRFAVIALILTAVAVGQSALLAAPTQGAAASAGHSPRLSLFDPLFGFLAAIWGRDNATVVGAPDNPGRGQGKGGLQQGGSTDAAIWGCPKCG